MNAVAIDASGGGPSDANAGLVEPKRVKILATVGPACGDEATIRRMVECGVNVFRINFSHGDDAQRETYLSTIRRVEVALARPVAVCADLCGPKIRVGMVQDGKTVLEPESEIVFQRNPVAGSSERISTTFPELVDLVSPGERILLADGRLRLEVVSAAPPNEFTCRVVVGGELSSGKGVNLPDTELPLSPLTEKDRQDVDWISQREFDFVALSFVQRASDVEELRQLLKDRGSKAQIIAKIEKPQAIKQIDEIIEAAHAIMVARGDLGVEMPFHMVPTLQKSIARKCQASGTTCIIATEMLESMIQAPTPTRAEVSDLANAVFDRADAVMLSAESSIGKYPVEAVQAMAETVVDAQEYLEDHSQPLKVALSKPARTAALAGAIRQIMKSLQVAAVAMYTDTGTTARLISKNQPACPVLALARDVTTVRRCCLYYGVISQQIEQPRDAADLRQQAIHHCKRLGLAKPGDYILVVAGHPIGAMDQTNGLTIEVVE